MMKLSFDKRLDKDIMKAYCTDFQIIETRFFNSSEFSSLRLRWETAVALQAETEQAEHADISSRKGSHGKPCILYFQVCRGADIRVQSKYAFGETSPIGSTDGEAVGTSEYKGKKWLGQMPTW